MPRPSLRTGRADFPHPALRSMVYRRADWRTAAGAAAMRAAQVPDRRPGGPVALAACRSRSGSRQHVPCADRRGGLRPSVGRELSPLDRRVRHYREDGSVGSCMAHPSSCPAFAPRPLRRFTATTRALTSRPVSAPAGISLLHASVLPSVPSPTIRCRPAAAFCSLPLRPTGFPRFDLLVEVSSLHAGMGFAQFPKSHRST